MKSGAWDGSTGGGDHARGNANRLPESGRDNRVMQIKGQICITQSHWQSTKKENNAGGTVLAHSFGASCLPGIPSLR